MRTASAAISSERRLEELWRGECALEEPPVEFELRREVVVEHGRGDARAPADLVDRRTLVPALGEHLGGGALDDLAARLGADSLYAWVMHLALTT